MCGICAGDREKVSLGDVIIAEQLYDYDEGKSVAEPEAKPEMFHNLRTFNLRAKWKMDAAYLAQEMDLSALSSARPPSKDAQRRRLHPDRPPADPPLRIHVGAIGTGRAVREDPQRFERLRRLVRTTLGADTEAVFLGDVAARFQKRVIVIKAVSDHADQDKDNSFRAFACRASAEVLLAFLVNFLDPDV